MRYTQEMIDALKVEVHGEYTIKDADFSGCDLSELDLRFIKFINCKFNKANLTGANLYKADLKGLNLCGADLRYANLYGANLQEANLLEAYLYGADLRWANLQHAYLEGDALYHLDEKQVEEIVNNPQHYTTGGLETIDYIKAKLGDGFNDFCIGNILKYVSRCKYKDNMKDDLLKARKYIDFILGE